MKHRNKLKTYVVIMFTATTRVIYKGIYTYNKQKSVNNYDKKIFVHALKCV